MTHGERYTIELDTESEAADHKTVASGQPLTAEHTVRKWCRSLGILTFTKTVYFPVSHYNDSD